LTATRQLKADPALLVARVALLQCAFVLVVTFVVAAARFDGAAFARLRVPTHLGHGVAELFGAGIAVVAVGIKGAFLNLAAAAHDLVVDALGVGAAIAGALDTVVAIGRSFAFAGQAILHVNVLADAEAFVAVLAGTDIVVVAFNVTAALLGAAHGAALDGVVDA